jgi:hypothetical protein
MQAVLNESENIAVDQQHDNRSFGRFRLNEIAAAFPAMAETLLLDTYLANEDAASARVFRVYPGDAAALSCQERRIPLRALAQRHVLDPEAQQTQVRAKAFRASVRVPIV